MLTRRFLPLTALGSLLAPRAFAQPLPSPGLPIAGGIVTGPATFSGGVSFGSVNAGSGIDLSKHIALFGTTIGINVTGSNAVSIITGGATAAMTVSSAAVTCGANLRVNGNVGFYNTAAAAKQTVSGAKGSNAALASLMTALVAMGLVTDTTSA
jgi:hypothetical protein